MILPSRFVAAHGVTAAPYAASGSVDSWLSLDGPYRHPDWLSLDGPYMHPDWFNMRCWPVMLLWALDLLWTLILACGAWCWVSHRVLCMTRGVVCHWQTCFWKPLQVPYEEYFQSFYSNLFSSQANWRSVAYFGSEPSQFFPANSKVAHWISQVSHFLPFPGRLSGFSRHLGCLLEQSHLSS